MRILLILLLGSGLWSLVSAAEQPNIIYILLDDAGYGDLSCYGQKKFETPNVDRLALEVGTALPERADETTFKLDLLAVRCRGTAVAPGVAVLI